MTDNWAGILALLSGLVLAGVMIRLIAWFDHACDVTDEDMDALRQENSR